MNVTLIAHTSVRLGLMSDVTDGVWKADTYSEPIDDLAEFAGRSCYQSWSKPNPNTRSNKDYLANVIDLGHESVLSHASATFYITGVSRSLTHELIRHRWLAFSELSQRYVSAGDLENVVPPAFTDEYDELDLTMMFKEARSSYEDLISTLESRGISGKKAREAARAVLPNMTETRIVVTGNMRAWRDFLEQRLPPGADAEIRQLAEEIYRQLNELAPNSMIGVK